MGKSFYLEDVESELWERWTNSFPREQSIQDRLIQLIREDVGDE